MTGHVQENELALSASGDLGLWRFFVVRLHTSGCSSCRAMEESYRQDRQRTKQEALDLPPGVDWDRLAAEMTANIRVGLEAGECVAPRRKKHVAWKWAWQAAAAAAAITLLIGAALWLNFPASDKEVLGRAMGQLFHGRTAPIEDRGPVVEASATGIELRENGGALKISQGALRPVAVSVSAQGSASARYVDADTGQVTITSVYVQ